MSLMNPLRDAVRAQIKLAEASQAARPADSWRPLLHLAPPTGFSNDPNGLCYFRGLWHVFFQYAPFSAQGGLKCWGHWTSPDLLSWTYHGAPLLPDEPFDCHGAYSGCAFVENGKMHVFYSGNVVLNGTPERAFTVVHVVSEDGFEFSAKKPVILPGDYPSAVSCQIRDPKVWRENGEYCMVLGAQTSGGSGALLFYRSADLERWSFDRVEEPASPFGYMWECPDVFSLAPGGRRYLSVSPQGVAAEPGRYANIFQSVWAALDDAPNFKYTEWDKGFDFYAPQTFEAPDGRRILYGWMGMDALSGYTNPTAERGWQHALTLPRVITERNGELCQMPPRELESLRGVQYSKVRRLKAPLPLELRLENKANSAFSLRIGGANFDFSPDEQMLHLSFADDSGSGRGERTAYTSTCRSLRAWVDTSSIEIFIEDGRMVFTTRFYPQPGSLPLCLDSASGLDLTVWELDALKFE